MNDQDFRTLLEGRLQLYRLLSRLYIVEVDDALWASLKGMHFPESADEPHMAEGWRRLAAYIAEGHGENPVEELAVDYARIFLSAGVSSGAAYPIESVYTSPEHLVMQDAWEAVCGIYRANGFGKREGVDVHEDQLGLELDFMAVMTERALTALEKGSREALLKNLEVQKSFLESHLLNWIHHFAEDVRNCPGTDFYKAVSLVTEGFLEMDRSMLEEAAAEAAKAADAKKA